MGQDIFVQALTLLLLTTGLSVVARWAPWPHPITYVLGGVIVALVPAFPHIALDPGFFFLCFLPPLLFSDGWLMPLREFAKVKTTIFTLATGLVVFTTIAVGFVGHWLMPHVPLAMTLALGAVVSPTDAVAVGAITQKLKLPSLLTVVLDGESLMNDATGLVGFKFALAAVVLGTFSMHAAALNFCLLAAGGLAVGLATSYLVGRLRDLLLRVHSSDTLIEITISLLTPYAAYVIADEIHVSGILSVVAAGLYAGWRDPVRMDAETRQSAWAVWSLVLFWLNGLAFLLLGLQFPHILSAVTDDYSLLQLFVFTLAIAAVAILARIAWFFPGAYLPYVFLPKLRASDPPPSWKAVLVGSWAGMRGTVTLAAALSIPLVLPNGAPFPGRDIVIFLAFGVIAVTLLVQGTTIESLIRWLDLREGGERLNEEHLARTTAVDAGLQVLRALEPETTASDEAAALGHVIAEYEQRLSALSSEGETRTHARRRRGAEKRFRFIALEAERLAVNELWRNNVIADEVHRPLQQLLDHEEGMLRAIKIAAEE